MKGTGQNYAKRQRIIEITEARLGDDVLCNRCGATLDTYADRCTSDLGDPCPGFQRMEQVRVAAQQEVGW